MEFGGHDTRRSLESRLLDSVWPVDGVRDTEFGLQSMGFKITVPELYLTS